MFILYDKIVNGELIMNGKLKMENGKLFYVKINYKWRA